MRLAVKLKLAMSLGGASHFHFGVADENVLSLVVLILASAYSYFEFCNTVLKVHFQRDDRATLQFLRLAHLLDFVRVGEELSPACREMVETVGEKVFIDMCTDEPEFILVFVDINPRFAQSALAVTDRLDFRTDEHDSHFKSFIYKIEVVRLAVLDNGRTRFFLDHL